MKTIYIRFHLNKILKHFSKKKAIEINASSSVGS